MPWLPLSSALQDWTLNMAAKMDEDNVTEGQFSPFVSEENETSYLVSQG